MHILLQITSQRLRSIIEYLFHRGRPPQQDPGLSAFTYMQSNNLDEEFKQQTTSQT